MNTLGTRIRQSGERLILHVPRIQEIKKYAARRVEKIVISGASSISSGAVALAVKYNIDIVYLGDFGFPIARVIPSAPIAVPGLKQSQLSFISNPEKKFALAVSFVIGKALNQLAFLKYLQKISGRNLCSNILEIEMIFEKISVESINYEKLLGQEGKIAEKYFSILRTMHGFPGRKPGGTDKFNSTLNYGYGVLYNEIEKSCLYVGLDSYIGIYHSDRYGKPSLVLDLIEEWRVPIVDSVVFQLFWNKKIDAIKDFDKIKKGEYRLSKQGKRKLMTEIFGRFNKIVYWEGKNQLVKHIIMYQVRQLAQIFLDKRNCYKPFLFKDYE